jgi:arsenite methyltransferase
VLKIEKLLTITAEELENLPYYELTARLGLLSFNSQGTKSVDLIATYAGIGKSSTVLVVGCGTGRTAVHLAEITGASVYGIDLLPESIRIAQDLASGSPARDRLHFSIGDASALSFPPNTFDAVITEYVAFLLPTDSFAGFRTVLKPGGLVALAELVKDPAVSEKANAKIAASEASYADLIGYKFHIPLVDEYMAILTRTGFQDVLLHQRFVEPDVRQTARTLGGWKNVFKISMVMLKLMMKSPVLKKKFLQAGWVKNTLIKNRSTAKYIFQAVMTGRKPA